jgi:hypothetical protein
MAKIHRNTINIGLILSLFRPDNTYATGGDDPIPAGFNLNDIL